MAAYGWGSLDRHSVVRCRCRPPARPGSGQPRACTFYKQSLLPLGVSPALVLTPPCTHFPVPLFFPVAASAVWPVSLEPCLTSRCALFSPLFYFDMGVLVTGSGHTCGPEPRWALGIRIRESLLPFERPSIRIAVLAFIVVPPGRSLETCLLSWVVCNSIVPG